MPFHRLAGLSGIAFVAVLLTANLILTAAGFPTPSDSPSLDEITRVYTAEPAALRLASALLPAAWTAATIFAVGVGTRLRGDPWAVVGVAGVLMQSVVFTGVEATRLALAAGPSAGLWGLHNALFGFNQVFLATALLGLTLAGRRGGLIAGWHTGTGLVAAGLLFLAATTSPYDPNPLALAGLIGWLLWLVWIVAYSLVLLRTPAGRAGDNPS